ncbi:MAG: MFS transporter [Dehalococcoidia bacterium]|nr:MFS transporter [Dehalococcoidia bacterium]
MTTPEPDKREARPQPGRRRHYAWIVVAVTFATLLVGAGVRTAPGVLIRPLEQDFGWDRASISLAVAIGIFIFGLTAPMAGALLDRFGPRRVMLAGASLTVLGLAPLLAMREIWQLYIFMGLVTGVGTGAVSGSLGAVVAARWFKTHRGIVIGIFGGATSMGQLIFIPSLLGLTTASGWRSAVGFLIVMGVVLLAPIALLMRNYPADKGLLPFGDDGTGHPGAGETEQSRTTKMSVALRGREFWLLAGSYFICGYTTAGLITTHLIPYSLEHGFNEATTAGTMALMGAMNLVGTLSSGWLTDRYDNRRLLAIYFSTRAISLVALPFIMTAPQLLLFAVIYGFDWVATVPPVVNLTATIYGKGSLGVIYGWIFFAHMMGASIAAYAGGYLRDALGDYNVVFAGAAVMAFIAVGFSLGIRLPGLRHAEAGS